MKQQTLHPLSPANLTTIFGNCSGRALTAMGIMDKVRNAWIGQQGFLQLSIMNSKHGDVVSISTLKSVYEDNPKMIEGLLHSDIILEILNY